jgi:ADP-heptose:LPS heptosyltransferase
MIIFFYFENTIKITHNEFGFSYEHKFEKVVKTEDQGIPFDKVYFSTPSDFRNHMENIKKQVGDKGGDVHIVHPPKIVERKEFPKHIGFQNIDAFDEFKGKPKIKIAVLNAMSNALGDHLIGMQAFDYWQEKVREYLPGTQVDISLYQLNPYRVGPVTKQWHPKFNQIFMLPNRVSRLVEYDAFIDLGSLLLRDNFDTQPMIDFFYEAMSIDPKTVPDERKRIKYQLNEETVEMAKKIFNNIRALGRPILMFHHTSTSPIRGMSNGRAKQFISKIIKETDYFVVSACGLDYQNKRFMDIKRYSKTFDDFATLISLVDAIITVDTSTYHVADAFDIPTVALFTTINPEFRCKYYPHVESIMLEEEDGKLYGRHKMSKEEKIAREEVAYVEEKWANLEVSDIIEALEKAKP